MRGSDPSQQNLQCPSKWRQGPRPRRRQVQQLCGLRARASQPPLECLDRDVGARESGSVERIDDATFGVVASDDGSRWSTWAGTASHRGTPPGTDSRCQCSSCASPNGGKPCSATWPRWPPTSGRNLSTGVVQCCWRRIPAGVEDHPHRAMNRPSLDRGPANGRHHGPSISPRSGGLGANHRPHKTLTFTGLRLRMDRVHSCSEVL